MKQATIVAIVLGILVLISAVQASQLNTLKEKLTNAEAPSVSTGSSNTASAPAGEKRVASLPSSVKDLPQMVGGC